MCPDIQTRLLCVFGTVDPLIPAKNPEAIGNALGKTDLAGQRMRFVEYVCADHLFRCEARSSFHSQASAQGWSLLIGDDPAV